MHQAAAVGFGTPTADYVEYRAIVQLLYRLSIHIRQNHVAEAGGVLVPPRSGFEKEATTTTTAFLP